jgi:hypothetical protein
MALVNYNGFQRIAVAILDEIVNDDYGAIRENELIPVVVGALKLSAPEIDANRIKVCSMIRAMIEQGSLRREVEAGESFIMANTLSRPGVRAMAQVWRGNFPVTK